MTIEKKNVLLVDDKQDQINYLKEYLDKYLGKWIAPLQTFLVSGSREISSLLHKIDDYGDDEYNYSRFDIIMSDLYMPACDKGKVGGIEIIEKLAEIHKDDPENAPCLIVISNRADAEKKVTDYASDYKDWLSFYAKPPMPDQIGASYESGEIWCIALSYSLLKLNSKEATETEKGDVIIGSSGPLQNVLNIVDRVGPTDAAVLIEGASGTGKELIAKRLHDKSNKRGEYVTINCAALTETLVESELFGHKQGSFSSASYDKKGLFEVANDGTIFLDEIGEMPLQTQPKLLRILENRTFRRVGDTRERTTNARVIAATNKNLSDEVAAKRFREDLYRRLNVISITLPSLSDRREDIPLLVNYYLEYFAQSYRKSRQAISGEALKKIIAYPWPQNIGQLKNAIAYSVIVADNIIETKDLKDEIIDHFAGEKSSPPEKVEEQTLTDARNSDSKILSLAIKHTRAHWDDNAANDAEMNSNEFRAELKKVVVKFLNTYNNNRKLTAKKIGISRTTINAWLKELRIPQKKEQLLNRMKETQIK